jgi:hydroxypyruvate reductase
MWYDVCIPNQQKGASPGMASSGIDLQRLTTSTLGAVPWGAAVTRILAAALYAVEPARAVRQHMRREENRLTIGKQCYNLRDYARVFVVGAGKAGAPMARAAREVLGSYLSGGIVTTRATGDETVLSHSNGLTLLAARHPVPDERGVQATRRIVDLLEQADEHDLVLVLLSGGGSALLTHPAPDMTLDDMQHLTELLLASGATINEINSLRKHLDTVKGGGLARAAAPATLATLVLSDVVGNPLDVIASGPTVPDSSTFADAFAVLERYDLREHVPVSIVERLRAGMRGDVPETPKADDPIFGNTQHVLVGSNEQAADAALHAARVEGCHTLLLTTRAQGEARVVGRLLGAIAREVATSGGAGGLANPPLLRPACLILGGETTVTLRGTGKGGRNQELALAAVEEMAGLEHTALVTLATDGNDGPTDAAGAVVTGETLARAQALGLDPAAALANNDAYPFFDALGDLLRPGPTHTNVNDLALLFAW